MTARAFADALFARYARRAVSPVPLGVVFRRAPRAVATSTVVQRLVRPDVRVELRPRIELTLVREAAATPGTGTETVRTSAFSRHDTLVLRTRAVERVERVLERVLARGVRVEAARPGASPTVAQASQRAPGAAPAVPASPRALGAAPAVPPPRFPALVVQRQSAPAAAPAPRASDGAVRTVAGHTAVGPVAVQAVEIESMTDHVIAAIDRRLVAQRERLGRP